MWSFGFLMYRVELKVKLVKGLVETLLRVPNVPCGVESPINGRIGFNSFGVPNVPCGVESYDFFIKNFLIVS